MSDSKREDNKPSEKLRIFSKKQLQEKLKNAQNKGISRFWQKPSDSKALAIIQEYTALLPDEKSCLSEKQLFEISLELEKYQEWWKKKFEGKNVVIENDLFYREFCQDEFFNRSIQVLRGLPELNLPIDEKNWRMFCLAPDKIYHLISCLSLVPSELRQSVVDYFMPDNTLLLGELAEIFGRIEQTVPENVCKKMLEDLRLRTKEVDLSTLAKEMLYLNFSLREARVQYDTSARIQKALVSANSKIFPAPWIKNMTVQFIQHLGEEIVNASADKAKTVDRDDDELNHGADAKRSSGY